MESLEINAGLFGLVTAITMGLTEIAKPFIPNKNYTPIVSMLLAVLLSLGLSFMVEIPLATAIVTGLYAGLASCGLYDVSGMSEGKIKELTGKEIKINEKPEEK